VEEKAGSGTDIPAFADLVREHQAMVFSIAWHFLRDRTLAEEVAQDVFLQLHRNMAGLKTPAHVSFWLRKVAANRAIDYSRSRKLRAYLPLENAPEPHAAGGNADPMLSRRLRTLLASLPGKARMVMIMRYQEDLDPADIAELLGMPVRTVKSHLQRSLALLREKLSRTAGVISI
jgi:RNA polymerase sigma-70 factor, ECF subfamily